MKIVEGDENKLDSLWSNGIILRKFIGEANALKFKTEADSAISIVSKNFWVNFKEYSVKISMPGNVIATNGFVDSSKILVWPVKSDYFLTEPYVMWAESKIPNRWAWIVSGIVSCICIYWSYYKDNKKRLKYSAFFLITLITT